MHRSDKEQAVLQATNRLLNNDIMESIAMEAVHGKEETMGKHPTGFSSKFTLDMLQLECFCENSRSKLK